MLACDFRHGLLVRIVRWASIWLKSAAASLIATTTILSGCGENASPPTKRLELPASASVRYDERNGAVTHLTFGEHSSFPDQYPGVGAAKAANDVGALAQIFLRAYEGVLKIENADEEFVLKRFTEDALGFKQVRFSQTLRSVPIWGADIIVEINPANDVVAFRGHYLPTPTILTTASVGPAEAKSLALEELAAPDGACDDCEAQLVIYGVAEERVRLAYLVTADLSLTRRWNVLVDAHNGEIIARINRVPTGGFSSSLSEAEG